MKYLYKRVGFIFFVLLYIPNFINAQEITLPFTVTDGKNNLELKVGLSPDGGEVYVSALDQYAPPSPPSGSFDARLKVNGEDYLTKYMDTTNVAKVFEFSYAKESGQSSISLSWDNSLVGELGTVRVKDIFGGSLVNESLASFEGSLIPVEFNSVLEEGFILEVIPESQEQSKLSINKTSMDFAGSSDEDEFIITSTLDWEISGFESWIGVEPTSGNGNETVTVYVTENGGDSLRSDTLIITAGEITKELLVTQEKLALPPPPPPPPPFGDDSLTVSIPFAITDGKNSLELEIGISPDGDENYVSELDQYAPPSPPSGSFDARLKVNGEDYLTKYLDTSKVAKEFEFKYAKATGQSPISISWDDSLVDELGTARLKDRFGGNVVNESLASFEGSLIPVEFNSVLEEGFILEVIPGSTSENDIADLVANYVEGPVQAYVTVPIEVEIDVSNEGVGSAGTFNIDVSLSEDQDISTQNIKIGTIEVSGGLNADEVFLKEEEITIPSSFTPGEYYLVIEIDKENEVLETNEENNAIISTSSLVIKNDPELVGNALHISDEIFLNDSLHIEYEFSNAGFSVIEDDFDINIYLSDDLSVNSDDRLISNLTYSKSIAPSEKVQINHKIFISSDEFSAGQYTLGVELDSNNKIEEDLETNNIFQTDFFTIGEAQYIDLVADDIQTTGSFAYELTALNEGNIDASGNFQIGVFLSKDNEADENDLPISIHAGYYTIEAESELEFTLEATEDTTEIDPGEYFVWFAINLEGSGEENIDNNIFMTTNSIVVSNEGVTSIPTEFTLFQNYPNPFNPTTQITYQLPKAAAVSFGVYDMTGREVYSFKNQQKPAGEHAVTFDASNLSSGIYIYQLKAGSYIETKKMTLIK